MTTPYSIKVTKINNRFHCRLYNLDKVIDEVACQLRIDIGYVCRDMLRTIDKCGIGDEFTHAARLRNISSPAGKIFYHVAKSGV